MSPIIAEEMLERDKKYVHNRKYKETVDLWVENILELNPSSKVLFSECFASYTDYSLKQSLPPLSRNIFSRKLKEKLATQIEQNKVIIKRSNKTTLSGVSLKKEN